METNNEDTCVAETKNEEDVPADNSSEVINETEMITESSSNKSYKDIIKEFNCNRCIIIRNISLEQSKTGKSDILEELRQFITSDVSFLVETGGIDFSKDKGHATVTILNGEIAESLSESLNGKDLFGKKVSVSVSPNDNTLCLAHLPDNMNDASFRNMLESHGSLEKCFLMRGKNNENKGYGIARFDQSRHKCSKLQLKLNNMKFRKCSVHCEFLSTKVVSFNDLHSKCILIDSLPPAYKSEEDLKQLFSKVASPIYFKLCTSNAPFGVAEYSDAEHAGETQAAMNRYDLKSKKIRVSFCIPGLSAREVCSKHHRSTVKPLLATPPPLLGMPMAVSGNRSGLIPNPNGLLPTPSIPQLMGTHQHQGNGLQNRPTSDPYNNNLFGQNSHGNPGLLGDMPHSMANNMRSSACQDVTPLMAAKGLLGHQPHTQNMTDGTFDFGQHTPDNSYLSNTPSLLGNYPDRFQNANAISHSMGFRHDYDEPMFDKSAFPNSVPSLFPDRNAAIKDRFNGNSIRTFDKPSFSTLVPSLMSNRSMNNERNFESNKVGILGNTPEVPSLLSLNDYNRNIKSNNRTGLLGTQPSSIPSLLCANNYDDGVKFEGRKEFGILGDSPSFSHVVSPHVHDRRNNIHNGNNENDIRPLFGNQSEPTSGLLGNMSVSSSSQSRIPSLLESHNSAGVLNNKPSHFKNIASSTKPTSLLDLPCSISGSSNRGITSLLGEDRVQRTTASNNSAPKPLLSILGKRSHVQPLLSSSWDDDAVDIAKRVLKSDQYQHDKKKHQLEEEMSTQARQYAKMMQEYDKNASYINMRAPLDDYNHYDNSNAYNSNSNNERSQYGSQYRKQEAQGFDKYSQQFNNSYELDSRPINDGCSNSNKRDNSNVNQNMPQEDNYFGQSDIFSTSTGNQYDQTTGGRFVFGASTQAKNLYGSQNYYDNSTAQSSGYLNENTFSLNSDKHYRSYNDTSSGDQYASDTREHDMI